MNDVASWLEYQEYRRMLKRHNVTDEEVGEWNHNFKNYKTSEKYGKEAYKNQPVEVDARKAGRDFVNSMTPEDFEKYKSKAGVK